MGIRSTSWRAYPAPRPKPAKSRNDWIQQFTDFDGRYYQLNQARLEPKPIQKPYPPIVIGGSGEQLTLRVVALPGCVVSRAAMRRPSATRCASCEHSPASAAIPSRSSCQCRCGSTTTISQRPWRRSRHVAGGATPHPDAEAYPYPEGIVVQLADEVVGRVS